MKKKTLDQLKRDGWDISEKDKDRISTQAAQKKLNRDVAGIASAVTRAAESTQKSNQQTMKGLETILKSQLTLLQQMIKNPDPTPVAPPAPVKNWEFDIKRNKKGFISKVYAKAK